MNVASLQGGDCRSNHLLGNQAGLVRFILSVSKNCYTFVIPNLLG